MALKAENLKKVEDGRGEKLKPGIYRGRSRMFYDKYEFDGNEEANDKVKMVRLPSHFTLYELKLAVSGEVGATMTLDVGTDKNDSDDHLLAAVAGDGENLHVMSTIKESDFVYETGDEPEYIEVKLSEGAGAGETVEVIAEGAVD